MSDKDCRKIFQKIAKNVSICMSKIVFDEQAIVNLVHAITQTSPCDHVQNFYYIRIVVRTFLGDERYTRFACQNEYEQDIILAHKVLKPYLKWILAKAKLALPWYIRLSL